MLPARYMEKPLNWSKPEKKLVKLSKLKSRADEIRGMFFSTETSFLDHVRIQNNKEEYPIYISVLVTLLHQNCELQFSTKWKTLSASFATRHYDLSDYLLYQTDQFSLPEVLKSIKLLDMQRLIRQLKKRVSKLEKCGAKKQTVNSVKNKIIELEKEVIDENEFKATVPGSLGKRIRKWVGKFSAEELAFFSVQMPKKPWTELADIIHFSPKDFKLPYFLPVAFGAEPPEESLISICAKLNVQNVEEAVKKHKIPYSYLRKNIPMMSVKVKEYVARYEKIDTLIWYYEEFTADGAKNSIDKILEDRLKKGEIPSLNYGKLLERILYFKMCDSDDITSTIPKSLLIAQQQASGSSSSSGELKQIGSSYLKEIRFGEVSKNKEEEEEVVSVIVTTCEGSSYDNIFRTVEQKVPVGRVSLYGLDTNGTNQILRVLSGHETPTDPVIIQFLKEVRKLDPDCVLFNWECCSGCNDQGFKNKSVIELVEFLIKKGHVVMFSDFAVKALIKDWDERRLGPKAFFKIGECSNSVELRFKSAVLDECGIPQLEAVGQLCGEKGLAKLHCLGGTVVVGVDWEKAGRASENYSLEVLTVCGKVDGKEPKKSNGNCDWEDPDEPQLSKRNKRGPVGHAVLRYHSGGEMIISAGHWIELSKLDTSIDRIIKWAKQYGTDYEKEIKYLQDKSVPMEQKKIKMREMSKMFVQQMPSVKQKKKKGKKFYEYLFPIAQQKLSQINLQLEKPFYIFGDASGSMGVCVRTSTIIASFISCITDAKLMFFNTAIFYPKIQPKTIQGVIDVALTTKAKGRTGPAKTIIKYLKEKKKVKVFLLVTDEVENVMVDGTYFAQHFWKYYTEVYPAKLVLVSFLKNPSQFDSGQMVKALKEFGIEPVIFSMHLVRPDLQKLDKLVGLLSLETSSFLDTVEKVYEKAKSGKIQDALSEIQSGTVVTPMIDEEDEEEEEEDEGEQATEKQQQQQEKEKEEEKIVIDDDDETPKDFLCPITREVMRDPVVCSDGHTYERDAIVKWIDAKATSPMTGAKLTEKIVFPNHGLKSRIVEYLEEKKKIKEIEKN